MDDASETLGPVRGRDIYAVAEVGLADVARSAEVSVPIPGTSTSVHVRVPQAAETGTTVRIPGRGKKGRGGAEDGDLVVEFFVGRHRLLRREGLDLTLRLPVTLSEAYSGASIVVPSFSGECKVEVPPFSQNGDRIRVPGRGLSQGERRGDLYVQLEIESPTRDDASLHEAFRKCDAFYDKPVRSDLSL